MAGLAPYLAPGRTLVILGSSGVGKSSLINALLGQDAQATAAIRAQDGKGRHTTTARQLLMLPGGAMIIDTPGMREMGLLFAREGLRDSFAPVEELIGRCRFSNCTHTCEPGCAVRRAGKRHAGRGAMAALSGAAGGIRPRGAAGRQA